MATLTLRWIFAQKRKQSGCTTLFIGFSILCRNLDVHIHNFLFQNTNDGTKLNELTKPKIYLLHTFLDVYVLRMYLCVSVFVCARMTVNIICKWWYKLRFFLCDSLSFSRSSSKAIKAISAATTHTKKRFLPLLFLSNLLIKCHIRWLWVREGHI